MRGISITIHNKLKEEDIITTIMPINPLKAINGYYSRKAKIARIAYANDEKINKRFIVCKVKRLKEVPKNTITILLPSGAKLSYPEDATDWDYEIIKAQLNVLAMRFKQPTT